MGFSSFLVFLFLLSFSSTLPSTSDAASNHTDLQLAIEDMRSKSFYGFAILLQMLNTTSQQALQDITFFIPEDPQLSNISISVNHLEDFILRHSIPMPLQFGDLVHFPTGSLVPSESHNRMMKIRNHGRGHFVVNNAEVSVPNVCASSDSIKCHGIDAVLDYGTDD